MAARLRVYIAGAYRSRTIEGIAANMRRGIALAHEVLALGHAPFVPWLDFQLLLAGEVDVAALQAASMAWLEAADAVLVVPDGWRDSLGTVCEVLRAVEMGKPVHCMIETLVNRTPVEWGGADIARLAARKQELQCKGGDHV